MQYGTAFAIWTEQGMQLCDRCHHAMHVLHPFTIMPLRVAKQVATMVIALSAPYSLNVPRYDILRALILNRDRVGIPHGFRFYLYLMRDGEPRLTPMGVPGQLGSSRMPFVECEIALPPFGYVIMADGEAERREAADLGFCDITPFFRYGPLDLETVFLRLACHRPKGPISLVYDA